MRDVGIARAIFYFLVGLPFLMFRFARFVRSIPSRLRRNKHFRASPKMLIARLAHKEPTTLLRAVECIGALSNASEVAQRGSRPRIIDLIEELWDEEVSGDWRLPSVAEVTVHRQQLLEVLTHAGCTSSQRVWAVDETTHMFAVVDLFVPSSQLASPSNVLELMRGRPPDSIEVALPLAVRVTAIAKPTSL